MTRRWMTALMVLLALAMLGATGCVRKKKPVATATTGMDFGAGDRVIVGWNADGTPIYADDAGALGFRLDGAEMGIGQFEPVYFDFDSQQLNPGEMAKIEAVANHLRQNPTLGAIVEGHTDERGSTEYNLSLGERRALAVRAALISSGIDGNRVQSRTYGEERPVAFGHDESSWRLNRRAEFVFTQM